MSDLSFNERVAVLMADGSVSRDEAERMVEAWVLRDANAERIRRYKQLLWLRDPEYPEEEAA